MQTFEATHRYPASVQQLFALFGRPDFWQDKYAAMGDQQIEILRCETDARGELVIESQRQIPVKVPAVARKVIAPVSRVIQRDRWWVEGEQRAGSWSVEVVGRPLELGGTARLVPDGEGACRNEISGRIAVNVPLVGKVVAKLLVGNALRSLQVEQRLTLEALQRQRPR